MVSPAVVLSLPPPHKVCGQCLEELGGGLVAPRDGAVDERGREATDDGQEPGTEIPEFHLAAAEQKIADPAADYRADDAEYEAYLAWKDRPFRPAFLELLARQEEPLFTRLCRAVLARREGRG